MSLKAIQPESPSEEMVDAARTSRIVAWTVDKIILVVPFIFCVAAGLLMARAASMQLHWFDGPTWQESTLNFFFWVGMAWMPAIGLLQTVLLVRRGQSLGKIYMGIKVVRINGDRADIVHAVVLRILVPMLIFAVPVFGWIAFFMDVRSLWRPDLRCLHDKLAETRVVAALTD